jgi:hypothetical protein
VLINEYDRAALVAELSRLVARCGGESWPEVAAQVSRLGRWEFEA